MVRMKLIIFRGKNQAARDIAGRFPISHHWDPEEPKLLVCEAKCLPHQSCQDDKDLKKKPSLTKTMDEGPVSQHKSTTQTSRLYIDMFPCQGFCRWESGEHVNQLFAITHMVHKIATRTRLSSCYPSGASIEVWMFLLFRFETVNNHSNHIFAVFFETLTVSEVF